VIRPETSHFGIPAQSYRPTYLRQPSAVDLSVVNSRSVDFERIHASIQPGNFCECSTHVLGGLKVGCKRLFLHSPRCDKYLEMSPDCVLDFYVHESCQRSGIGLCLLEVQMPALP